ncbi:hypothetical protein AXK56_09260 [Tsukamurella pulmonis]|uniref:Uncharacterized protein n=1 Tax=Tsukamurella pulmonis TaxID=47312 RepID=A0A1H1BMG6_9ACTN|nr:hypothetical protein [Tsukamurella pulmonis]KXO90285.1 hypothetical protein AXK56_09260 [Tsukamurella pulmonis]SDQ52900.1 hypothetical protein SAMN04489765_0758 [Tsukamurella pulmonis]SUP24905.1 Uncharacterised protein [Tsukamurella pulmonis]
MRFGLEILGREVLAVTVGVGDSGEDPDADHLDDGPTYELGSDSMPVETDLGMDDDEDAPRPLVIVRGDHLRDRTTRTRRNPPPFIGSGPTRGDVRNDAKRSTTRGFGFHA